MSDNPFIDKVVKRERSRRLVGDSKSLRVGRRVDAPHVLVPISSTSRDTPAWPSFMAVRLGTKELFGVEATWQGVAERLRRYSLAQVLQLASWVTATLPRGAHSDLQRQGAIAAALFGADSPRMGRVVDEHLESARREGESQPIVVLFDELQVINLVKAALLVLPARGGDGPAESPVDFGQALLMVGELIEKGPDSVGELYARGEQDQARYAIFVNALFHVGQHEAHALARAHDLFLSDKPHLQKLPVYLDLPHLVKTNTGLEPDQLWAVLFGFFGHTVANAGQPGAPIRIDRYFRNNFRFTASESRGFFGLVARSASALKREARAHYSPGALKPYHVLPLAETPLVTLGGNAYIPSRRLLVAAMTSGLYHRLLNALPSRRERGGFQQYMGRVFEDYVERLLKEACGAATSGLSIRYVDGETISKLAGTKRQQPKTCDGLALTGDTAILFEAKAKLFSLAVRSGAGFSDFRAKHEEIVLGSAQQIDDTIQAIERGDLHTVGVDGASIRRYFPLIVSLDNFPMLPPVFDAALRLIADQGLLHARSGKTAFVQLMDIDELELFDVAIRSGRNVAWMMERKVSRGPAHSFRNFWHLEKEVELLGARSPYLENVYKSVSDRALAFMRSRAVEEHLRSNPRAGESGGNVD